MTGREETIYSNTHAIPRHGAPFHDNMDPTFHNDACNIHIALFADGVNPFKKTRFPWLTWLVMLLNYNLPP